MLQDENCQIRELVDLKEKNGKKEKSKSRVPAGHFF